MSALHEAVARAIAYADWQAPPEIPIPVGARHDRMAAVAIGVMLAEATQSIEALDFSHGQLLACYISGELAAQVGERPYECPVHQGDACLFVFAAVADVLAVLTALAEHAA